MDGVGASRACRVACGKSSPGTSAVAREQKGGPRVASAWPGRAHESGSFGGGTGHAKHRAGERGGYQSCLALPVALAVWRAAGLTPPVRRRPRNALGFGKARIAADQCVL